LRLPRFPIASGWSRNDGWGIDHPHPTFSPPREKRGRWIPAYAGMTDGGSPSLVFSPPKGEKGERDGNRWRCKSSDRWVTLYNGVMKIKNALATGSLIIGKRIADISPEANRRLKWFDYYRANCNNARLTCRHFDISPQTFY
jgi:hypothetical protein